MKRELCEGAPSTDPQYPDYPIVSPFGIGMGERVVGTVSSSFRRKSKIYFYHTEHKITGVAR